MTEADWLTEDDLEYLLDSYERKASRRKLRLFAVGCVRSILHLLPDQNCRTAVEGAEEYADRRTTLETLRKLHAAAETAMNTAWRDASLVERDGGMVSFATRQDALASDLPAIARAITKEEFEEVSARDTIDAMACVLAHSAISPDQWGTSAGDDAAMRTVAASRASTCGAAGGWT
jgi:hypothetical protein